MTLRQAIIRGPFKGKVTDLAPLQHEMTAFDDVLNFFVRKGRIQSRPQLGAFLPSINNNQTVRYIGRFKDANQNLHSFFLKGYNTSQTPASFLTTGPLTENDLLIPGLAAGQLGSQLPFGEAQVQNQVYFSNLGYPLMYLDGSNAVQFAGDVPGCCQFLTVNANHLIGVNWNEPATGQAGSARFPRRTRWSGSGNPLEWNGNVDFTAGVADNLEVPDDWTGAITINPNTYLFRQNGITVMFPTGIGLNPFEFENYTEAEDGIGNKFPYSLSVYGNRANFVAEDDVYLFTGSSFDPIGGPSRKAIMSDLSSAAGDQVWGRIMPNFTQAFDFPCYMLTIPGPNITWIYTYDDGQWVRFSSSQGFLTAVRTVYTS